MNEISDKYIDIGELYLEKDNYEQTIGHYLLALNYYEENHDENIDNIINAYKKIISVYKTTADYNQVNIYEEKIKELLGNEIEFQE
jgi:tetratricopeptide (TPR) repeat protein